MKQIILDHAQYNLWANEKIRDVAIREGEEITDKEQQSSFSSIKLTIFHMWDAEVIWLRRIKGESVTEWPSKSILKTGTHFLDGWIDSSKSLVDFAAELSDEELKYNLTYRNMKGEEFSQKLYQILMHLFNHGTYHRGQAITLLRNAGVEQGLPQTDLIEFYRQQH